MSPSQATKVQIYLRAAADKLGLAHWHIALSLDPLPEDGPQAEVHQTECQHATVRLPARFFDFTPAYQRLVLAHELCHLHLSRSDECVQAAEECMDAAAYKVFYRTYSDSEEQAVEAFARLLAPNLALPKFGGAK